MPENCFHPSIEGAQHGAKNLPQFLEYAKKSGASGAQPSNYMLQSDKGFKSAKEIKDTFANTPTRWALIFATTFIQAPPPCAPMILMRWWRLATATNAWP